MNLKADETSQIYYYSWIYDCVDQKVELVVDDITDTGEAERKLLTEIGDVERKQCKVGLWCIQMKP